MSNEEINSVAINVDDLINIRFAWIARNPNERMIREAQEAVVSCFASSDQLGVGLRSKTGKLQSLHDLKGFIMPEHIQKIREEWSKDPIPKHNKQYGCVIIFPHRFLTQEVENAIDALQLKLKTITQNEWFRGAVIIY